MASFIAEKMLAKAELEAADSGCKVSDSELAYWLLEHSMLAPEEKKYVPGQAGEAYKLTEIRATLENLYPQGSEKGHRAGGAGKQQGHRPSVSAHYKRRWGHLAEEREEDEDGYYAEDLEAMMAQNK